jgi:hypothetical protein
VHAAKIAGAGAALDQPLEPGDPFSLMAHETAVGGGRTRQVADELRARVTSCDDRRPEVAGHGLERIHGARRGLDPCASQLGQPALDDDLKEPLAARRELVQGALGAAAPRQLLGAVVQEPVAQEYVLELLKQALETLRAGRRVGTLP